MASADDVFDALVAAMKAGNVPLAIPGDLTTAPDEFPLWKVRPVSEAKQSFGRNSIGFTTLVTIRLTGEVSEPVSADDDVAVSTVVPKLMAMKKQAERLVINSMPLFGIVQQLASVTTQFAYVAQDTRLAGIQSDYTFEIIETAEDFFQFEEDDLAEIDATDPNHPGVGLTVATT